MTTKKTQPHSKAPQSGSSLTSKAAHAQAQAEYRARNLEATREKARLAMQRRRAEAKLAENKTLKSIERAEKQRAADSDYKERKRMRTYISRYGHAAFVNHYLALKFETGANHMPGILAEGKRWRQSKAGISAEARTKRFDQQEAQAADRAAQQGFRV
ncbi:hypothetical protein K438DRAFT_1758752 [Mycena galopus ATCC 62051]|nr:hypothetical protein K438DRAFT_1793173 [Mycena galopus ATCC 62051]KAF8200542.1 hypothetical protein K438DRAFT_1758752 [Mycena galopus ATCC 62051]